MYKKFTSTEIIKKFRAPPATTSIQKYVF